MEIYDDIKKEIIKNLKLQNKDKAMILLKLLKELIIKIEKDNISYVYCLNRHLDFINKDNILAYTYYILAIMSSDKPYYLISDNKKSKKLLQINNFFTDEYKIDNTLDNDLYNSNELNKNDYYNNIYYENNFDINFNYPIDFIHPCYGKIYLKSYKDILDIHLFYFKCNDVELSKKWLDITMLHPNKPKYINYSILN